MELFVFLLKVGPVLAIYGLLIYITWYCMAHIKSADDLLMTICIFIVCMLLCLGLTCLAEWLGLLTLPETLK